MTREEMLPFLRKRPFEPFRVHLKDGRQYDVLFSHLAMAGTKHLHIGHPAANQPDFYDNLTIVNLDDVVRAEPLRSPHTAAN
jgi:hypothetical protein